MKIRYNAPITLNFTFVAAVVLIMTQIWPSSLYYFISPCRLDHQWDSLSFYFKLFSYVFGHVDFQHYLGNFTFVLLLGPLLEEKYGSFKLFLCICLTTIFTGIFNTLIMNVPVLGASGIVFMMILLTSFTNFVKGEVPLTFIFIFLLFVVKEIYQGIAHPSYIADMGHVIGGSLGSILGYFMGMHPQKNKNEKKEKGL